MDLVFPKQLSTNNQQVYSYKIAKKKGLLLSHPGGIVVWQSRYEESGMLSVHIHHGKTVSLSHTKQPMEVRLLFRGRESINTLQPTVLSSCIHAHMLNLQCRIYVYMYHSIERKQNTDIQH